MLKQIIALVLSLSIFQFADYTALKVFDGTVVNSHGPYSANISPWVLVAISIICLLAILYLAVTTTHKILFTLIFCAGLSNLLDRAIYGGVIDYIYLYNISIVNIADITIFVVAVIIIWQFILKQFRHSSAHK